MDKDPKVPVGKCFQDSKQVRGWERWLELSEVTDGVSGPPTAS